jgi:hypothetical protein
VWLLPVDESEKRVQESATTTVREAGAEAGRRTEAVKSITTTEPGTRRSDAVIGVLLGTGALLFVVFAFWGRIAEIGLPGGGSIRLTEAEVPAIGVDDVAAAIRKDLPETDTPSPARFAQVMTDSSRHITSKTKEIASTKEGVVLVDLGGGDKWLLPNLYFLVFMLEKWTCISLVVFTEPKDDVAAMYVACSPPAVLRRRLEEVRPAFADALPQATDTPIDSAGPAFFQKLSGAAAPGTAAEPPTWVSSAVLLQLARPALTLESVEVETRELKVGEMRAILDFPHAQVPITTERRLVTIVERARVALKLARFAVRSR